jgi:histone H3/H4
MSRNRLEEIMARRNLHKQRLANAATTPVPQAASQLLSPVAPMTPIIPLTPLVTQQQPARKQQPTTTEDDKPLGGGSKLNTKMQTISLNQPVKTKRVPPPPPPKEEDDELEFSDNDHQFSEEIEDEEDFEDEEVAPPPPKVVEKVSRARKPTQEPTREATTRKTSQEPSREARKPTTTREPTREPTPREARDEEAELREEESQDANEVSANALPRAALSRLLKTSGFGFSSTVMEAAIEILQEIVNECIRDKSITTGDDINRLVSKHFPNGEDDLPEKVVLNESQFSKFVNPLFQARKATCKRDAFYMLHLFCEGFILKMMRAADMVAGNSRRSLIQANDLTIAYNIYSM